MPSDLKYAFESPVEIALLRARYQGPRPLPAVFLAAHSEIPFAMSAARRRRGVFHWPQSGPQSQSDPASEGYQHLGRFAEAEIAAPAPHIGGQFFHCRLDADALGPSRSVPDSLLEPFQRFRRNRALDVRTSRKAEPEELSFLRSCHRTLGLIYLELELLCDEARDALHHPLTRAFAANIDITVVRIANKAMSAALQLAVELVEHEVT